MTEKGRKELKLWGHGQSIKEVELEFVFHVTLDYMPDKDSSLNKGFLLVIPRTWKFRCIFSFYPKKREKEIMNW